MKKILNIFQILLQVALIFFIVLIWARYFISSLWLGLLVSLIVTIFIELAIKFLQKRTNTAKNLKLQEKEEAENMFLSLCTSSTPLNFFYELAKTKHKAVKKGKYILIEHEEDIVALIPILSFSPLQSDDLLPFISLAKKNNWKKIVVVCGEVDRNTNSFAKNFDIEILLLDKYNSYSNLYKPYDFFPTITMKYKKDKKLAFKDLIAYSFNRGRTKGYLFSAFILFLSSLLIRPSIYYCIVASILLLFALISYTNPYFNPKIKKEVL